MNLVFTGRCPPDQNGAVYPRLELTEMCAELGWSVSDTVSSVTTVLVAGEEEIAHPTKKVRDARRAGIAVHPYRWFFAQLNAERRSREDHARASRRGLTVNLPRVGETVVIDSLAGITATVMPSRIRSESGRERVLSAATTVDRNGMMQTVIETVPEAPSFGRRTPDESERVRRIVAETWKSWGGAELRQRAGLSDMEFDWISTWMDRLGITVEWRSFGSAGVMFRLTCGRAVADDLTWEQVKEQVEQKRALWMAKHEPAPVVFGKRTRKMLL